MKNDKYPVFFKSSGRAIAHSASVSVLEVPLADLHFVTMASINTALTASSCITVNSTIPFLEKHVKNKNDPNDGVLFINDPSQKRPQKNGSKKAKKQLAGNGHRKNPKDEAMDQDIFDDYVKVLLIPLNLVEHLWKYRCGME